MAHGDQGYVPFKETGYVALASTENSPVRVTVRQQASGSDLSDGDGDKFDTSFVAGDRFQAAIGAVIFLNVLVLWGETDLPGLWIWYFCDSLFLCIFIAELALHLNHNPKDYLFGEDKLWSCLEITIVTLGIFDLWIFGFLQPVDNTTEHHVVRGSFLRMLRLTRLLRLFRVFKIFTEMKRLARAFSDMGLQFVWIFVVLWMVIICTGIIMTHLLGHQEALGYREYVEEEYPDEFIEIKRTFGDVWTSVFTLFQITTTDNWEAIARPIIKIDSRWRAFFVAFIVFTSWTIISILTAVASNSMFEASADKVQKEQETMERNRQKFIIFLRKSFQEADLDNNNLLDKEEFEALLQKQFVHKEMKSLGIHLSHQELINAWSTLDYNHTGELTIDEFVEGLSFLQEGLGTKHIVNVEYTLKRVHDKAEAKMQQLNAEFETVIARNEEILQRLKDQGESQHQQQLAFWLWQQWALRNDAMRNFVPDETVPQ